MIFDEIAELYIKDTINGNIEYLLLNHLDLYDSKLIEENVETVLSSVCKIAQIKRNDYKKIGQAWMFSRLAYTSNLIDRLDRENSDRNIERITPIGAELLVESYLE